jgi:hypothetical protein
VFENLIYDACYNHVWPNFFFNPLLFSLIQYTISVIYILPCYYVTIWMKINQSINQSINHGTGSIFNVLNNSLWDVFILTSQINLTSFFCILKLLYFVDHLPKKRMPYLRCEWKFAKYTLLRVFILVTVLSDCIT